MASSLKIVYLSPETKRRLELFRIAHNCNKMSEAVELLLQKFNSELDQLEKEAGVK